MQAFGDRLQSKYAGDLDEQGRDFVSRMQQAAGRMQVLINDLLSFSRVTTVGRPFVPCDLARVAQEVLSDLEVRIQETNSQVNVGDLPTIDADPWQMRQQLQNLIGNAIKYRRDDVAPLVAVAAKIVNGSPSQAGNGADTCRLTVTDNGIGFEPEYAERIFGIFRRLHGRGKYQGTGVGLAICRKISERHHGSMTAEGRPGEGATFTATLSANQTTGRTLPKS